MLRRLPAVALLALVLGLPAAAPAYPPITCGRTTVAGHAYVVRTHGPNCSKAIPWARAFIARHRSPRGFRCRAYGASVPAQCVRTGRKNTYFFATKP
jgi:hypothetical protein